MYRSFVMLALLSGLLAACSDSSTNNNATSSKEKSSSLPATITEDVKRPIDKAKAVEGIIQEHSKQQEQENQ
ncbi:hypothetical protein [Beggiatoa leptomitoformis]|uniref:Uncharacterized protein n=1 Tax=Beggiatoa leptomitoformis TaxID=288004 RepID=A0A2N9YFS7_9GAMM|nr:hypothetical protein [Beggiatoa leptomitoformis]ALG68331.1 hypothetical protein AL038_12190 [Beggiatoa leptomitoformis]AUI69352.1 hypothetical protein BLE401_12075 [Beggiatoa leptomitoformis]